MVDRDGTRITDKNKLKISKNLFVLKNENKFQDDYKMLEKLGEGAFGTVGK